MLWEPGSRRRCPVCVDMDRHTLVHAYMEASAPGRLSSHLFLPFFDSIACACLFPNGEPKRLCGPLSGSLQRVHTDWRTDAPSAGPHTPAMPSLPSGTWHSPIRTEILSLSLPSERQNLFYLLNPESPEALAEHQHPALQVGASVRSPPASLYYVWGVYACIAWESAHRFEIIHTA